MNHLVLFDIPLGARSPTNPKLDEALPYHILSKDDQAYTMSCVVTDFSEAGPEFDATETVTKNWPHAVNIRTFQMRELNAGYANPLPKKGHSRLFIREANDLDRVYLILHEVDAYETTGYMPLNFVKVTGKGPVEYDLVYNGKFEPCQDQIRQQLWECNIPHLLLSKGQTC